MSTCQIRFPTRKLQNLNRMHGRHIYHDSWVSLILGITVGLVGTLFCIGPAVAQTVVKDQKSWVLAGPTLRLGSGEAYAFDAMQSASKPAPESETGSEPEKVIIDTDIGDDIDDAFALALAVKSRELQILGIATTFGDTETRARIVDRFLGEIGRSDIPVMAGKKTPAKTSMSQGRYADGGHFAKPSHGDAVDFLLGEIEKHPGEITLICIGPLFNVGEAIDRDAGTFRKLKRVVMMGGSIRRGYGDLGYNEHVPPQPEWNILNDVGSAQKLFASGVPVYVMPLDATQLKLDEVKRAFLFTRGTTVTDQLTILYHLWAQETPTLFDPMAVAFAIRPELCPVTPLHIRVDEKGYTLEEPGAANAQVCLDSKPDDFFMFYLKRVGGR
jgi:purine nucleosidase